MTTTISSDLTGKPQEQAVIPIKLLKYQGKGHKQAQIHNLLLATTHYSTYCFFFFFTAAAVLLFVFKTSQTVTVK